MMRMFIMHGRLDPDTGGTDLEGKEVDDWGFEGPSIDGVVGISYTYNNFYLRFKDAESMQIAAALTGWEPGPMELALEMKFKSDCLELFNIQRFRSEYFGDWGIYQPDEEPK